jgi:hypothetical protein
LWQFCGNLWQREEKCGKGCGNVAILLYICVNKKRLIILVIKHLTFLPQLPQLNCHKIATSIYALNSLIISVATNATNATWFLSRVCDVGENPVTFSAHSPIDTKKSPQRNHVPLEAAIDMI